MESSHSNPLYISQFSNFLASFFSCPVEMFVYYMWKICICISITAKSYNPHYILLPAVFNGIYPTSEQSLQITNNIQRGLFSQPDSLLCSYCLPGYFYIHISWARSPTREICLEELHVGRLNLVFYFTSLYFISFHFYLFFTYFLVMPPELYPNKTLKIKYHEGIF